MGMFTWYMYAKMISGTDDTIPAKSNYTCDYSRETSPTYLEIRSILEILYRVWHQVLIRPEDDGDCEAKVD